MFKAIIEENLPSYLKAKTSEKTAIITSIVTVSGMQRKAVIRALNRERKRSNWQRPLKLGRPRKYLPETDAALAWIWEQYDYPRAERLHDEVAEGLSGSLREIAYGTTLNRLPSSFGICH